MSAERKNIILYILTSAMRNAALIVSSEAILQTFLYSIGFNQNEIYLQSIIYQAFNMAVILLLPTFADRGSIGHRCALALTIGGAATFIYIPLCFTAEVGVYELILLFGASALGAAGLALHTVCMYKLPYYIFTPSVYGPATALCGIVGSGISFLVGSVMTALSAVFVYSDMMIWVLLIGGAVFILSGFLHLLMRPVDTAISHVPTEESRKISLGELTRHPSFYTLLPGNFLRGVAMGATMNLAVVASDYLGYPEEITTAMASVSSVAIVLGCVLYGATAHLIPSRVIAGVGSVLFLLLPLALIPDMPILYLSVFGVAMFGRTLVDYSVPTELLYVVPSRLAGPYNAFRMAIQSVGILLSTAIAIFVPAPAFVFIATAAQLIAGMNFFFAKIMKNKAHKKGESLDGYEGHSA